MAFLGAEGTGRMGTPDFLEKDAETPHVENYLAAGIRMSVATNFPDCIQIVAEAFAKAGAGPMPVGVQVRLWVDPPGQTKPPWPKPFFRGLGHLVFAGFDAQVYRSVLKSERLMEARL